MRRFCSGLLGLSLVICMVFPTHGARRGRLRSLMELNLVILRGEVQRVLPSATSGGVTPEQRLLVRVTQVLRGKHLLADSLSAEGTLWLQADGRSRKKSAGLTQKGSRALFFLRSGAHGGGNVEGSPVLHFHGVVDVAKARKLGPMLRKARKVRGQRVRQGKRCGYATFSFQGKCRTASQIFDMITCPLGSKATDARVREFGLKMACTKLRAGTLHGDTYRWNEFGTLESRTAFREGKRHGMRVVFGAKGKRLRGAEYQQGEATGRMLTWHGNGQPATEAYQVKGLPHGVCKQFDATGKLLGTYKMTHGTGLRRVWREDGSLQLESERVSGQNHGARKQWHANGQLLSEGRMTSDSLDGRWVFHDAAGAVTGTRCYQAKKGNAFTLVWSADSEASDRACPVPLNEPSKATP